MLNDADPLLFAVLVHTEYSSAATYSLTRFLHPSYRTRDTTARLTPKSNLTRREARNDPSRNLRLLIKAQRLRRAMPRRPFARALTTTSATPHALSPALPTATFSDHLLQLRRQWKWAAFCQFFFTFAALFNMNDVTITDIEDDLTRSTSLVLSRIMQRLLYTLTQDRKVNLDNWQTALRKQYLKRDPEANPLGPEPSRTPAPGYSPEPEVSPEIKIEDSRACEGDTPMVSTTHPTPAPEEIKEEQAEENTAGASAVTANFILSKEAIDTAARLVDLSDDSQQPQEESKNWLELPMLVKLDSVHILTEWQCQNPQRLRTIMKNDDEAALWRIEPIGYDAKSNAYWLIGADRLWIQRALPKPPQDRKRKRPVTNGRKGNRTASEPVAKKNRRHVGELNDEAVTLKLNQAPGRSARRGASQSLGTVSTGRGGGRAAKAQAKMKMDAQAKDLAEFQRQATAAAKNKGKGPAHPAPVPRGTRLSKRLRGSMEEEDWQPVPDEWLAESNTFPSVKLPNILPRTGLESDDDSALTSLSDDNEDVDAEDAELEQTGDGTSSGQINENILDDRGLEMLPEMPSDFIEWETIAVTLYEWEHIAERFEKATHYSEKALYKVLTVDIVPVITAELKEILRQRQLEEALVHRKRSSRIALKESEKEEAELAAKKRAEEDEKMSRARRLEVRQQKEEVEREKRESAREQRRSEREQRELQQARQGSKRRRDPSVEIDVVGNGTPSKKLHINGVNLHHLRQANGSASGSASGTRTPAGEDWELDCEICFRRGINQDDGQPMMSCGICTKWQHIPCHDNADLRAGRRKRDWDIEEFVCQRCRSRGSRKYDGAYPSRQYQEQSFGRPLQPPAAERMTYIQPTANFASPGVQPGYAGVQSHAPGGQNGHDNFRTSTPTSMAQQQPYQPHSPITFAHYQPDPEGFSTRQTYQRDLPGHSQVYQRQTQYAGQASQQLQSEVTMNLRPVQPSVHQSQAQYGNSAWNSGASQQNYGPYNPSAGFSPSLSNPHDPSPPYAGIPQWQPPHQAPDTRVQANHYQHSPVMGSTPNWLPR